MRIVIAEEIEDTKQSVVAAYSAMIAVAKQTDRTGQAYAVVRSGPVARHEQVAVIFEPASLDGVPSPIKILVRDSKGPDPIGVELCVRRAALPVCVDVDVETGSCVVLARDILGIDLRALTERNRGKRSRTAALDTVPPESVPMPKPAESDEQT